MPRQTSPFPEFHLVPHPRWQQLSISSGPVLDRLSWWLTATAFVILAMLQMSGGTSTTWNTTCSLPCACQLQTSDFTHSPGLRTVNCSNQHLKSLPSDLPRDTEALLLPGNGLTELFDYVPDLLDLKELDVTGNRVRTLGRRYIFHNLSGLTYLSLAKNDLVSLVRDVFSGLIKLQVLTVAENRINQIEDQAFHGLISLRTLDLGHNQLNALYPEWFYGLSHLEELYLYENRIHLVNGATFRPVPRLQHLSLHGNKITHVSSDAFWGLNALATLHLERNYLREVPIRALLMLPVLRLLYLSGNEMTVLKSGDIADLPVVELVMNNLPRLRLIEAGAFRNLSKVTNLELRDCPSLAFVDAEAFVNVTVLQRVDLQRDGLRLLPREVAKALPAGAVLHLRGNPLLCDCNVRWIRQELELAEKNKSRVVLAEPEQLMCYAPEHAHGMAVRQLDGDAITLPPQCAPSILPLMASYVEKTLGDTLSLDCRAAGVPRPRIRWTLPGGRTVGRMTNDVRMQVRPSGTLFFYHLKDEDAGNYTCGAENLAGHAEANVQLVVKRIDIHIFPTRVAANDVTVVWNGTARNNFSKFQILYRPTELARPSNTSARPFEHVTVSQYHRSYTVNNLIPLTTYEFCIAFEDRDGYFVQISCTTVRTQDPGYSRQGIHHNGNVAVAAVLGIIVTMVMVICLVTGAAKKYRQRQYVCPDKPVIHRMSHIPLENLYSPLMSNTGP